MFKLLLSIFLIITFVLNGLSQEKEIIVKVTNPGKFERKTETVSIKWDQLLKKAPWLDISKITVIDLETSTELVTQLLDNDFLFQSDFQPKQKKKFMVKNAPAERKSTQSFVDVKFVLPREDMAWENDRIAYRIYGSKLAGDVLNGIDVWVKRVRYPIIEKWYEGNAREGKEKISYHIDHGEGADFFTVGKSLGAGGCAIWKDGKLYQTSLFTNHKILATGPVRAKFVVYYEKDSIDGKPYRVEKVYTLDAGQNLNRIDVSYSGLTQKGAIKVAAGLVKRKNITPYSDEKLGWLSLWGYTNDDTTNEYTATGIIVPKKSIKNFIEDTEHFLIIGETSKDKRFTYYAGAGWTRSGDFRNVEEWNEYLKNFALRFQTPLRITIMRK